MNHRFLNAVIILLIVAVAGCASSTEREASQEKKNKRAETHMMLGANYLQRGQLDVAKEELEKAGGFENLMIKKFAMRKEDGNTYVIKHEDIEGYKEVFLTGIYDSLKEFYDANTPYSFWTELNDIVERRDIEQTEV